MIAETTAVRAPLSDEIPYFSEFVGKHIVSQGNTSAGRDHTGLDASTSVALISQRGRGEEAMLWVGIPKTPGSWV